MNKISNRVALVTGGARGIGRAICERLAAQGIQVAIGYHSNKSRAEEVKQRINEQGGQAEIFCGSVDSYFDVRRVIDEVVEHFGALNILVNNAGITVDKTLRKMSVEEWKRVIQINLEGTFYTIKASLEHILAFGWGRIVNISSIIALTGNVGQANYAAAKAGIIGLTKSLALELSNKEMTVNAVAPGFIETDMIKGVPEKVYTKIENSIPMKRFGRPEEVARVVDFLVQEESAYITGQVYGINGGLYM